MRLEPLPRPDELTTPALARIFLQQQVCLHVASVQYSFQTLNMDHQESLINKARRATSELPVSQDYSAHGASLHGENAARRQAITELLFFSSVGDLNRCKKICRTWGVQVCKMLLLLLTW